MNRHQALSTLGTGILAAGVPARASAASTLQVATLPIDGTALPYYAKDLGYFQDAGIDLTIQNISNGAAITTAVLLLMATFVAYMRWRVAPIRPRTVAW